MKTIHEILTLMYERYIEDINPYNPARTWRHSGLCSVLLWLCHEDIITREEHDMAKEYLYNNKPKKLWDERFFWESDIRRPRLLWMKKHMGITK